MSLQDVPIVCIDHSGYYKFIQVVGPGEKNYVYGNREWRNHNGLFVHDFLKRYGLSRDDFRCCGGGKIDVDDSEKVLKVFGSSEDFGIFDHKVVRPLLENYVAGENSGLRGFSVKTKFCESLLDF